MNYKIEQEGFELRGVKLGQKCFFNGSETFVIGFDVDQTEDFIAIKDSSDVGYPFSTTVFNCVILSGYENSDYDWVSKDEITLLPFIPSDDSLPTEISHVHVADILEDLLEMDMDNEDEQFNIRCIINECIKSLRQHN